MNCALRISSSSSTSDISEDIEAEVGSTVVVESLGEWVRDELSVEISAEWLDSTGPLGVSAKGEVTIPLASGGGGTTATSSFAGNISDIVLLASFSFLYAFGSSGTLGTSSFPLPLAMSANDLCSTDGALLDLFLNTAMLDSENLLFSFGLEAVLEAEAGVLVSIEAVLGVAGIELDFSLRPEESAGVMGVALVLKLEDAAGADLRDEEAFVASISI